MVDRAVLEEHVLQILERVDSICIIEHGSGVHHITIVGKPEDVEALDVYLTKCKRVYGNESN